MFHKFSSCRLNSRIHVFNPTIYCFFFHEAACLNSLGKAGRAEDKAEPAKLGRIIIQLYPFFFLFFIRDVFVSSGLCFSFFIFSWTWWSCISTKLTSFRWTLVALGTWPGWAVLFLFSYTNTVKVAAVVLLSWLKNTCLDVMALLTVAKPARCRGGLVVDPGEAVDKKSHAHFNVNWLVFFLPFFLIISSALTVYLRPCEKIATPFSLLIIPGQLDLDLRMLMMAGRWPGVRLRKLDVVLCWFAEDSWLSSG